MGSGGHRIRLQPDDVIAYLSRGNIKFRLRRFEDAVVDCDRVIRLQPSYASAYYNRGNVKLTLDRLADAVADYDKPSGCCPTTPTST